MLWDWDIPGPKLSEMLFGTLSVACFALFILCFAFLSTFGSERPIVAISGFLLAIVVTLGLFFYMLFLGNHPDRIDESQPHGLFALYGFASNGAFIGIFLTAVFPQISGVTPVLLSIVCGLITGITLEERRRKLGQDQGWFGTCFMSLSSGWTAGAVLGFVVPFVPVGGGALGGLMIGAAALSATHQKVRASRA